MHGVHRELYAHELCKVSRHLTHSDQNQVVALFADSSRDKEMKM
jgi:hypothetical protein